MLPLEAINTVLVNELPLDLKVLVDEGEREIHLATLQSSLHGVVIVHHAVDLCVLMQRGLVVTVLQIRVQFSLLLHVMAAILHIQAAFESVLILAMFRDMTPRRGVIGPRVITVDIYHRVPHGAVASRHVEELCFGVVPRPVVAMATEEEGEGDEGRGGQEEEQSPETGATRHQAHRTQIISTKEAAMTETR